MKSILYYTHVPWNWIKQRPQFIAEELSEDYRVDIFQEKPYVNNLVTQAVSPLKVTTLFRLPMNRITFVRRLNSVLTGRQLKNKTKAYDYIWITSPTLYRSIKSVISPQHTVIYDCMDDILAFPAIAEDAGWKKEMEKAEEDLIRRADVVLCTSEHLREKLKRRYNIENKEITIINNAINIYDKKSTATLPENIREAFQAHPKNMTYIGTISGWFDFNTVLKTLENHPDLYLFLFGPSEVTIPAHERLLYFGPVAHELVYEVMEKAGVLIMPFILNELILSVNPVKLYEYIYCQKTTIAKKYGETLKFGDYIYLYDDKTDFDLLIRQYCDNELTLKHTTEEYQKFGEENTWKARVSRIKKKLEQIQK